MSLINQMLQALEQRQDRPPEASSSVRVAAPPTSTSQGRWLWLGGASLLLLAFAAGWLLRREAPPPAVPQASAPLAETKSVAPVPLVAPVPVAAEAAATPYREKDSAAPSTPNRAAELAPFAPSSPDTGGSESGKAAAPAPVPPHPGARAEPSPSSAHLAEKPSNPPAPVVPKPAPSKAEAAQLKQTTPRQRAEQAYQQALAFQRERRDAEAVDALRRTLQLEPEHAAARQALAMQLTENGEADTAEALLKEGLQLHPGQPGLSMSLARLMVERGDDAGALELLDRQGNAGHFGADHQALYAALLQRAGRHADAVERYRLALGANPASAQNWAGLGISLRATGDGATAREAFQRALQTGGLDPALENYVRENLRELRGEGSE